MKKNDQGASLIPRGIVFMNSLCVKENEFNNCVIPEGAIYQKNDEGAFAIVLNIDLGANKGKEKKNSFNDES